MHELENRMIKKVIVTIVGLVLSLGSMAQIPDSTLYRTNKVKEVNSWVHVVGFNLRNDTCLFSTKKINPAGLPTYIKMDYNCQGWDVVSEVEYEYNALNQLVGITNFRNQQVMNKAVFEVDSFGRVIHETNTVYDPHNVINVYNTYYGSSKQADSMFTTQIVGEDTTLTRTVYTYVNEKLKKSETVDVSKNKPVNTLTNKYDQKGRLVREEFIYFLGYDNDNITKFEYNPKGQISITKSELDNVAAHFFYSKDGLPALTHYYNKFESLEREVWHKYTYYE